MDLRLTFNEDPENYEKFRPTYAPELFDDLIQFSALSNSKKALEIGIGTGQATLPFLKTGCELTAIEIGDKLAQFSKQKFSSFTNFTIINKDFESVDLHHQYFDLVYSSNAFHWIPPEIGLPKVYELLKSGGVFAWMAIHPFYAKEHTHIHKELQKIYDKYPQYFKGEPNPYSVEDSQARINTIKQFGFVDSSFKWYHNTRTFDAKSYTALLSTFSDHMAMPEEIRISFLKEIEDTINCNGGKFSLYDTADLCMARKP